MTWCCIVRKGNIMFEILIHVQKQKLLKLSKLFAKPENERVEYSILPEHKSQPSSPKIFNQHPIAEFELYAS